VDPRGRAARDHAQVHPPAQKVDERPPPLLNAWANTFYLSAASVWEIVIKHAAGKLRLPAEPVAYLRGRLAETPAGILPISHEHALQVALLPLHHRDPFDRMLIAQAQVEGLHLMTADRQFKAYPVDLVSA
jgi:PIN domain nuclease of toxin-antitoxin system